MKQQSKFLNVLGRIEGLPVFIVLVIMFGVFLATAPEVFSHPLIYLSFLQTVPPVQVRSISVSQLSSHWPDLFSPGS